MEDNLKRDAVVSYYEARKLTKDLGYTDKNYPRIHKPIRAGKNSRNIDESHLIRCLIEEESILKIAIKSQIHSIESYEREVMEQHDETTRLRKRLRDLKNTYPSINIPEVE